jgi:hypothetical protein
MHKQPTNAHKHTEFKNKFILTLSHLFFFDLKISEFEFYTVAKKIVNKMIKIIIESFITGKAKTKKNFSRLSCTHLKELSASPRTKSLNT